MASPATWSTLCRVATYTRRRPFVLSLRLACAAAAFIWAAPAWAAPAGSEIEFSPTGSVKQPRQVQARFPLPMIALGDPRAHASPFVVDCAATGTPRWIDTRTWVFDFDESLPGGIACSFTTVDGLRSLDGSSVPHATFSFSTGGPALLSWDPAWGEIEENQAVVLFLDAAATTASVLEHVHFQVDGIVERVGVHVVEGEARDAILATLSPDRRSQPLVIVQPRQSFPAGKKVRLHWGSDVSTPDGVRNATEQTVKFRVRPPFQAKLRCSRLQRDSACGPLQPIVLTFTAPVPANVARQVRLRDAGGGAWSPAGIGADAPGDSGVTGLTFRAPFPEETALRVELPTPFVDDSGRPLANADRFPLKVETAAYPPLVKFPSRFGILEADASPAAVVTVRNVERELRVLAQRATEPRDRSLLARLQRSVDRLRGRTHVIPASEIDRVLPWLQRLTRTPREASVFAGPRSPEDEVALHDFTLPKPLAEKETEVLGIPLSMPGLHIVEIESPRLGAALLGTPAPMYVPTAALVTNLGVHFKWGAQSSVVWVTRLADAAPVAGAEVFVLDCHGARHGHGVTDGEGILRIEGLPRVQDVAQCPRESWPDEFWSDDYRALRSIDGGLLVIARTDEDFSFVHSGWSEGIEPWRFGVPTRSYGDPLPMVVHTVLDRALFRAGDTVHMKHLLRRRTEAGLAFLDAEARPSAARLVHLATRQEHAVAIDPGSTGSMESTWPIPAAARLGRYAVELGDGKDWVPSATFRVEEFRVPLMVASLSFPDERAVPDEAIDVDVGLAYRAGGAAALAPVIVRSQVRPRSFTARHPWSRLRFANGAVQTGVRRSVPYDENEDEAAPATSERVDVQLDANGAGRVRLGPLAPVAVPSELVVDLEYRDVVGEVQSVARTRPMFPAEFLVAVAPERWSSSGKDVRAQVVVVDTTGRPVADSEVSVDLFQRQIYSHRKRLVGGFYAYEHITETTGPHATLCRGATDQNGAFACAGSTELSGSLILQATVHDREGRASTAHAELWIAGPDDWWFRVEDHDRIDLVPERYEVAPGDTARIQVRSPFANATALVTVEREGVLDTYVTPLSARSPLIEVPIRREYAPNAFVSVLLVRGRIGGVAPTAMLDLGKPAYKAGLVELRVGWDQHRLDVEVEPEREVHRIRERAKVGIAVRRASGGPLPADAEVAVAVVDEGLLELAPNPTWNALDALMELRPHWVQTATAQGHIVGKRHFGRKALPAGGGGGAQTVRELFDTLLYWNPRVPLDAAGRAEVEIPLNDSVTSFRIVAVATAGADEFGTGSSTIRTTQDLAISSGLPPVVREGDRFPARFTVRNATAAPTSVQLDLDVDGIGPPFPQRSLDLAPGAAGEVDWSIDVPRDRSELAYRVSARSAVATDSIAVTQRVVPLHRVETLQATLGRIDPEFRIPVAAPAGVEAGRGGLRIGLRPSLAQQMNGVAEYMRDYEFTCLEQRLSRAVALADERLWDEVVAAMPGHQDGDGLLGFFAAPQRGSVEATAYALSITAAAGLPLPDALRDSLTRALQRFLDGRLARSDEERGFDLPLRKLTAIEALSRHGMAEPSMLESLRIEPEFWPTASVLDLWSITSRIEDTAAVRGWRRAAERTLRGRLRLSGTTVAFAADRGDSWHYLTCPDALPLRFILHQIEAGVDDDEVGRVIRAALQRQKRGRWDCTTSNAWGAAALRRFVASREPERPQGATIARLGEEERELAWEDAGTDGADLELAWPPAASVLQLEHRGSGAPWALVESRAALRLGEAIAAGYRVRKFIEPIERRSPERHSRGDVWRVRLEVEASSDAAWVVVDDPLPPGASHLGTGLGTGEPLAGDDAGAGQPWWMDGPTYVERRHESFRAYYEWFPEGSMTVAYTIRLNQDGNFQLPPTRVVAMYAPESHAAVPNAPVEIDP